MKKDAYYFSHDANAQDDPKVMILIDQLGMEGYGIFWALIEKLRNESEYKLPLNIAQSFARRWGTSKEKIETVILKYDLFVIENEYFFSLRLRRSMIEKSARARESANWRWHNASALQSNAGALLPDANGMRNDAIKEKKRKEKKILEDFEIFYELYQKRVDKKRAVTAWMKLTDEERELAIKKSPEYVASTPIIQYRKNPSTYLNGKCWQDEIAVTAIISQKRMVD